jgi:hypothetical protein
MRLFHRRDSPPAEIVSLLDPEDRVLSWADVQGGGAVLASRRGLWWPEPDGPRLIGWQFVDKAIWRDGSLTVVEADVLDELVLLDKPARTVRIQTPRDMPPTVRKRVEANVAYSQVHGWTGGAGRFVGRRVPGRDGLVWWVRFEAGTADTDDAREQARSIIDGLRAPPAAL